MAFHIRNPKTDALARKVAAIKKIGLTEVECVLEHELAREKAKLSLVEVGVQFCRDLRAGAIRQGASRSTQLSTIACMRRVDVHRCRGVDRVVDARSAQYLRMIGCVTGIVSAGLSQR